MLPADLPREPVTTRVSSFLTVVVLLILGVGNEGSLLLDYPDSRSLYFCLLSLLCLFTDSVNECLVGPLLTH